MHDLHADFKDALRGLKARPMLTAAMIVTLGLGIGATTTVWSFAYALLLRPYPYDTPDRLIRLQSLYTKEGGTTRGMSLRDLDDYRRQTTTISAIGAYRVFDMRLLTSGPPAVLSTAIVNADTLSLLGVSPVLGRLFRPEEDRAGGDVNKAVIAYEVWQSMFAGDAGVIGKPLRSDRNAYTIVGVMPRGFAFPDRVSVWLPLESWYANLPTNDGRREKWRGTRRYDTIARMRGDATLAATRADLNSIASALERDYPRDNDGIRIIATPLREFEMRAIRPYLFLSLSGVIFVVVICCANVANLLLVRTTERFREVAVKSALGATNWRIARPFVIEQLMLAVTASVVGVALGWMAVRALLTAIPVPLPAWIQIDVDAPVIALSIVAAAVMALLFGVAPLAATTRFKPAAALQESFRVTGRSSVRSVLVVAEIVLAVVLLIGASLLTQSFRRLQSQNPGFESEGVAVARIVMWTAGGRTEATAIFNGIHARVVEKLSALPGVQSAAATNYLPYVDGTTERLKVDMFIKGRDEQMLHSVGSLSGGEVGHDYFATMRIPLVRGRLFEPTDTTDSQVVAIISERAARLFWPNQDPIGQQISWNKPTAANPWRTVVGIVGDIKHHAADGEGGFELYHSAMQWPVGTGYYVVRTKSDSTAMLDTIRRTITETEPMIAVSSVKTLQGTMLESLWSRRLWSVLFTAFAALAIGLAAFGVYGLLSHAVVQRTREIGVRIALGSTPARVRWLILRDALRLSTIGVVIGAAISYALWQFASHLLFGVTAYEPGAYTLTALAVGGATLSACWLPALKASRVDPAVSLRSV
jgi:putative ABC transport system permease protein